MDIIQTCADYEDTFQRVLSSCDPYEEKGVLHSEMLLFCSLLSYFTCLCIIESGRGRGQSAEVLARWKQEHTNINSVVSIDKGAPPEDQEKANARLEGLPISLIHGDSRKILVQKVRQKRRENTAVLIDGPKGKRAWNIAKIILEFSHVRLVAIHDMHQGPVNMGLLSAIWDSQYETYMSDSHSFVEHFSHLDKECWKKHKETASVRESRGGWTAPYQQGGGTSPSYGPTLLCLYKGKL